MTITTPPKTYPEASDALRTAIRDRISDHLEKVRTNPHMHPANQRDEETLIEGMVLALSLLEGTTFGREGITRWIEEDKRIQGGPGPQSALRLLCGCSAFRRPRFTTTMRVRPAVDSPEDGVKITEDKVKLYANIALWSLFTVIVVLAIIGYLFAVSGFLILSS